MDWCVDTGYLGTRGCDVSELKAILEGQLEHLLATAPAAAANEVLKQPGGTVASQWKVAQAAADACRAKLSTVEVQARACIEAACIAAASMGGKVTASIRGHHYPEHPHGIFKRISVNVERAAAVEETPEPELYPAVL